MRRAGLVLAVALALGLGGCSLILDFGGRVAGDDAAGGDGAGGDAAASLCRDGVEDGEETATDCGGPECAPCPTGEECLAARDCASGACALGACEEVPRNCASALAADPSGPSGERAIDPDGAGPVSAITVYCEQTVMGGGWQLVSVVPQGGIIPPGGTAAVPFLGAGACLDPATPCPGHIDPAQVVRELEVAVLDVPSGMYLILTGFAADGRSALRYFSLERPLTTSDLCTDPHVCGDSTLDPDLVATTSGYAMAYTPPLVQWWRLTGWWIGAGLLASNLEGNVFRTSYAGLNTLSTRATADGTSTILAEGPQRVYARLPAVPPTPQ